MNNHKEEKNIRVTVVDQGQYDGGPFKFNGTLDEVIFSLTNIQASIPEQYRATATCEMFSYEDSNANIRVTYLRPETDEECKAREDMARRQRDDVAHREREQYERLKAKFEKENQHED